jgi:hypothetical protein
VVSEALFNSRFKGGMELEFPRTELGGVRACASIVVGEALLQVLTVSTVKLVGMLNPMEDISVKHLACHPKL